jgi:hypothetical protein
VTSADAVTATPVTTTVPATTRAAVTARPVVAYDRYRTELQRIRAARQETQALQANERCINHQRFRKVGAEWEQAGDC